MSNNDSYDMKKKLLEMQSELLKDAEISHENIRHSSVSSGEQISESEVISLLKELKTNQQKMMHILIEIYNKISWKYLNKNEIKNFPYLILLYLFLLNFTLFLYLF